MLISELPVDIIKVKDGQWSDSNSRIMYFVDPTDSLSVVSRPWNQTEIDDFNKKQEQLFSNVDILREVQSTSIDRLIDDVGPSRFLSDGTTPNPAFVAGATSLNAIIGDTKANINANPATYITFLARALKHTNKAIIADLRVGMGMFDSTNTGAE